MKKFYHKHVKPRAQKVHAHIKRNLSKVKKRHIRTSITIAGVVWLVALTMLVIYEGYNFPINWFSIVIVSAILAFFLGGIEYLYIIRVKGY